MTSVRRQPRPTEGPTDADGRRVRRSGSEGFTLIELLIVVAVIGILSAITVISMLAALDRAKQRATMADMRTIGRAIEAYHVDNGFLPDDAGGMADLASLLVPYQINVVPETDHWQNGYTYTLAGNDYSLESFGKDGIDGADITVASRFDYNLDMVLYNGTFVATPE